MIKVLSSAKFNSSLVGFISKETGHLASYLFSNLETSKPKAYENEKKKKLGGRG